MTTGHSPSAGDYDATTALSRFASPQDLERIAETRPDLHSILATNPSIPPRVREILEQSDDAVVREVLARQTGRGAQSAQPAQPPVPGEIGPMAPTMAVGTAAGTAGAAPQQAAPATSGYAQVPQEYGGHQPGAPGAAPQGGSLQGASPRGYGAAAPQGPQGPPSPVAQAGQPAAPQPTAQGYSASSMQAAAQPLDQQTAMPPGVPSRVPSEYGVGQAYDSGPAYGPGQPAAPAYGTPMYAPPAPAPKKRRLLKVVAIVLPIILVLGAGGAAAWYFLGRSEAYLGSTYVTPSGAWANGADKAWSFDVDPHEDPYVFGDYLVIVDKGSDTLTAYSPLGDNMKEVWKTTVDDGDFSSSYDASSVLLKWGDNTLVHKSTLIDLKTGETSKAPWGESNPVLIVGDIAISCKESDKCTAWGANKKQKWSRKISGAGSRFESLDMFNATFLVKDEQRYLALFNAVINIDNGETLFLGGGSKIDSNLVTWYFQDGWGTLDMEGDSESDSSSSADREYKVTVYDFKGKKQGGYRETLPAHENVVEEDKKLPTAEEHRAYFKDQDFSDASLTAKSNSDGCITRIKPKQGSSINVPKADTNSIFSGCPSSAKSSEDGRIVKLMVMNRGDANTITALINVKTGKEIKFSGINLENEDTLIIAKPDLIIGYNKFDGKVIGFKPAS
ncbi:variant leucine-rich repeat-containing protein [Actinomyces oris]